MKLLIVEQGAVLSVLVAGRGLYCQRRAVAAAGVQYELVVVDCARLRCCYLVAVLPVPVLLWEEGCQPVAILGCCSPEGGEDRRQVAVWFALLMVAVT